MLFQVWEYSDIDNRQEAQPLDNLHFGDIMAQGLIAQTLGPDMAGLTLCSAINQLAT